MTASDASPVRYHEEAGVGIITLDRPEVRNAVGASTLTALERLLDRLERDPGIRALVLTGSGDRAFCAGGDLAWFATLPTRAEGLAMSERACSVLDRLAGGRIPVIGAANGDALGGGVEILCACHLRLAATGARIGFRHAAMGLVTGFGGGLRALRILGRARWLELFLTARPVGAEEARALGLVHEVVPRNRLLPRALDIASRIAANAPLAVSGFLELLRTLDRHGPGAAREAETRLFGDCWESSWFQDRLRPWR